MNEDVARIERVAVLAFHSSPLREPGSGDAGGMTVYVRQLARSLAELGANTDIFTRASDPADRMVTIHPGVRVIPIEAGPREPVEKETLPALIEEFAAGVRAFSQAQRVRYDLIHSHYWQSGLAAVELARWWGVPLVHSAHTLGKVKNAHLAPGDDPEPDLRLTGESEVIVAADALVASTDDESRHLADLYAAPEDKLKTLPPGVDHDLFYPADRGEARAVLGLEDQAVILSVGRIQPLKGVDLAIQATERLRNVLDRDPLLLVVGGASGAAGEREVDRLHDLVERLGIEDNVRFCGPQPHQHLPVYYRAAEAVVVSSHSESFGLTALEAHSSGCPVVGTPVGGLSHIVKEGESGFLLDERDPDLCAARLKTILMDPDVAVAFSARAHEIVGRYSWTHTAARYLELYGCLVRDLSPELCTC